MTAPLFIVFEGIDGAGTTTQSERLCARLRVEGHRILQTREPGGTRVGERIREILLDPHLTDFDGLTELMLYAAARRQLVAEQIAPALASGMPVISDRYADSTRAYQGAGRRLPMEAIEQLERLATGGLVADLTLVLDLPLETALARRRSRTGSALGDRLELAGKQLQEDVSAAYLELAKAHPGRMVVVAAEGSPDQVEAAVHSTLISRFPTFPRK